MERRASIQFNSKFATTYGRLFQGVQPEEFTGKKQDVASFWSQLLDLNVDREFLFSKLHEVRKDDCLGTLRVRDLSFRLSWYKTKIDTSSPH
ncbi:hypothetical protein BD310DRAFT_523632 [Dichomitus squalens]|uniref:Uncharacterized protein n=1 Tax=Dichomitus squalens TaxID=114155 RepID=A0A4Q9QAT4_9APHY|nr:hypothetical protein BD310DRAFT_523632 [Dichomitus squalens]